MRLRITLTAVLLWCSAQAFALGYTANYYAVYEVPVSGGATMIYIVPKLSILIVASNLNIPIAFMPDLPSMSALLASNGTLGAFSNTSIRYTANNLPAGATRSSYKLFDSDFTGDGLIDLLLQGSGNRESLIIAANANGAPSNYYSFGTKLNSALVQLSVRDFDNNGRADVIATGANGETSYMASSVGYWFDTVEQGIGNTALVGSIAGRFRVDEQGEATYSISIAAAPGTAGVTPHISLDYSSAADDGIAGTGWSLGGLSTISRCRKTLAQDNKAGGISLTASDRFCLDGQRLILTSGGYGASGSTYRTEIDSYAAITAYGGTAGNPDYFMVQRKDGSRSYYGNGNNSAQGATPGGALHISWAISRFEDSVGNPIKFTYIDDGQGQRLSRIDYAYGANTSASGVSDTYIEFTYQARPDSRKGYVTGYAMTRSRRLSTIRSVSANVELRSYRLQYRSNSAASYLEKLYECVGASCMPPTTFTWNYPQIGFGAPQNVAVFGGPGLIQAKTADIDGDGKADLIFMMTTAPYTLFYSHWNGNAFSSPVPVTQVADGNNNWKILDYNNDGKQDLLVGSRNQNWQLYLGTSTGLIPSDLGANAPIPYFPDAGLMDINGDGLPDLVYTSSPWSSEWGTPSFRRLQRVQKNGVWQYQFSAEQNFQINLDSSAPPSTKMKVITDETVDYNVDGKVDLSLYLYVIIPTYPSGSVSFIMHSMMSEDANGIYRNTNSSPPSYSPTNYPRAINVDLNHDGIPDQLSYTPDSQTANPTWSWYYALNTGTGYSAQTGLGPAAAYPALQFYDYNGDGNADLIYGSGGVLLARSFNAITQTFGGALNTGIPFQSEANDRYLFADVDGDGHTDLLRINNPGGGNNTVTLYRSADRDRITDRIVRIDNGLGNLTDITYKPMTDNSVYSQGQDTNAINWPGDTPKNAPVFDAQTANFVVAQVRSSAPSAGSLAGGVNYSAFSSISYAYSGARLQAGGRGFLGFATITTTDNQSQVKTTTTYRQDFPFIGQPSSTTVSTSGNIVLKQSDNTTTSIARPGSDGTFYYQVYTSKITEIDKDPENVEIGHTETSVDNMDAWGNVIKSTTSVFSAGSGTPLTRTIIDNAYDTSNYEPQFGRLTSTQVRHQRNCPQLSCTEDVVRTSNFSYYDSSAGKLKGLLKTEQVEPNDPSGIVPVTTTYLYDAFGNRTQKKLSAAGMADRYTNTSYDAKGRFTTNTSSPFFVGGAWVDKVTERVTERTAYGAPQRVESANGIITSYSYDELGREISRSDNTGAGITTRYSRSGLVAGAIYKVTTETSSGATAEEYFDVLGRSIVKTQVGFDGSLISSETEYDASGRVRRQSQPHYNSATAAWTEYNIDAYGRLISQTEPASGGATATTTTTYNGLSTTTTNPLGQTRETQRNAAGELTRVKDYLGGGIAYTYDVMGRLTGTINTDKNSAAQITIYSYLSYDLLGRKIKMIDADKGTWFYVYNAFGELTDQYKVMSVNNYGDNLAQALANGVPMQRTHMEYDRRGRMTLRKDFRENGAEESTTTWIYDGGDNTLGLLISESSGGLSRSYSYDTLGRLSATNTVIDGTPFVESVSYDSVGRIATRLDGANSNSGIRNSYNTQGYLSAIRDLEQNSTVYEVRNMDARGNVTTAVLGNGTTATWSYEDRTGQLQNQKVVSGAYTLQNLTYTWDVLGNQKSRRDQGLISVASNTYRDLQQSFCYDGLNRLTKTYQGNLNGTCSSLESQDQQYDAFGNITYKAGIGAYTYQSARPRTLQATGDDVTYTYDATGNLISDTSGRTLHYTVFDKPDSIVKGLNQVAFSYGPDRAFYKRVDKDSSGQNTTTYTIGGIEKVVKPGGDYDIKRYIAGVALWTQHFNSAGIAGTTDRQYLHKDVLGSIVLITDALATIKQQLAYNAWGERVSLNDWQTALPVSNFLPIANQFTTQGFTGHEMLDTVGLIHMQGRIYDARLGRFVQADPVVQDGTDTQAYNRYAYVRNNPLTLTDPSGFSWLSSAWKHLKKATTRTWKAVSPYIPAIVTAVAASVGCYTCAAAFNAAWTVGNGGSVQDGIVAGVSVLAFSALPPGSFAGLSPWQIAGRIAVTGAVGGVMSVLQGGKFGNGFIAAGLGAGIGGAMSTTNVFGGTAPIDIAGRIAVAAIAGGTISALSGGKFANGAMTGAFGAAVNEALSAMNRPADDTVNATRNGGQNTDEDIAKAKRMSLEEQITNVAAAEKAVREWYMQNLGSLPEGLDDFLSIQYTGEFPRSGDAAVQKLQIENGAVVGGKVDILGGGGISKEKAAAVIFHEYGHHTARALSRQRGAVYQNPNSESEAAKYSNEMCKKSSLC